MERPDRDGVESSGHMWQDEGKDFQHIPTALAALRQSTHRAESFANSFKLLTASVVTFTPMRTSRAGLATTAAALLFSALPLVIAHGHEAPAMNMSSVSVDAGPHYIPPPSYFRHGHYSGWMVAHIVLMVLAWMMVLPVAIMLSIVRSRFHLPAQVLFHIVNGLGVFTSFVYNHATPDLYENDAHHPLGWVVTSFTIAWTLSSLYTAYSSFKSRRTAPGHLSMTSGNMAQYDRLQQYGDEVAPRHSHDSGQGTERNSESLFGGSTRQNSSDHVYQKPEAPESPLPDDHHGADDEGEDPEKRGFLGNNKVDRFFSRNMVRFGTPRISTAIRVIQVIIERVLLFLGFAALVSGFTVYGGISRGKEIFSILAHFIKGSIFFWFGLLYLGRWMGAFGEYGWAWNIRPTYPVVPRWKSRVPSAEFTESFLIWFYGASNVFLEHLGNAGSAFSAQDFEHISITILFFGGGLLGMLIESTWVRELLNTNVVLQKNKSEVENVESQRHHHLRFSMSANESDSPDDHQHQDQHQLWQQPSTYKISLNPMPGLVIMILGMMMSGHHQNSMVSTMMHAQWGSLFFAGALARGATYLIMYLKPPTSHFPSRPPTELVAAFCLVAGGLMFMISAHDTVWAIESNGLDAMTVFTVTMGLTGLIMAWEVLVFCIKGWALRREAVANGEMGR